MESGAQQGAFYQLCMSVCSLCPLVAAAVEQLRLPVLVTWGLLPLVPLPPPPLRRGFHCWSLVPEVT